MVVGGWISEILIMRSIPILFFRWKRRVVRTRLVNLHGIAIKRRIGKELGRLLEIQDGEPVFIEVFVDACAAADDLFEFGHGLDALIQNDELAGLGVDASGHQLGGGGDNGVLAFRKDEVVQLQLAFLVVTRDAHDIAMVLRHQVGVFID